MSVVAARMSCIAAINAFLGSVLSPKCQNTILLATVRVDYPKLDKRVRLGRLTRCMIPPL